MRWSSSVFGTQPPTPRDVDEYWAPAADPAFVRSLLMLVHRFDLSPVLVERLRALRPPVLVIWGAKDRLIRPSMLDSLPSQIADARTVIIAGAGHVCNEEAPAEVNQALLQFLERELQGRGAMGEG